jgi:hypothetical protein
MSQKFGGSSPIWFVSIQKRLQSTNAVDATPVELQKIIENPDFSEAPFSSIHGKTTCPTIQSSTKSSYISHPSSKPWMFFMFQQPMIDIILLDPMLLSSINHISGYGIKSYYIAS